MTQTNKDIQIRIIDYYSDDYRKELLLRDDVLRKPLGMSLYNDNLERDKEDIHIGAFVGEDLVGTLILTKLNDTDLKMRQVAVAVKMQSQKIGTQIVQYAESYAKSKGYENMVLNARKTAVVFYEKQGYSIISEEFLEINIPHYKMKKYIG